MHGCCPSTYVLNSLAPGLVSTSSLWLVRYVPSSHIGCIPQCRVNGEFRVHHLESSLGSPVPFSVPWTMIITNMLIIDRKLLRYYQFQHYHACCIHRNGRSSYDIYYEFKIYNFKKGIGIESQNVCKQFKDQKTTETRWNSILWLL